MGEFCCYLAIPCAILKLKLRSAIYNVSMKKRLLSTTAALLTAALGIPLSCNAESTNAVNPSRENSKTVSTETKSTPEATNVVKVGEYQSTAATKTTGTVIARIQPHQNSDRQLVTLYVHNIPVMTFSSSDKTKTSSTKVGATQEKMAATDGVKVASNGNIPNINPVNTQASAAPDALRASQDPVWQATAVAAKLNQMSLDNVDGTKITVSWKANKESTANKAARYSIKVKDVELVEINANTRLPEQTKNLAEDALQVTNRLRRLLDNAQPLSKVAGMPQPKLPKPPQNIALGPVRFSLSGLASWYGPGFHGRRSANGEIYNQNALTAAHKSLPFGTRVRVTNKHTGRSVVVRINDRGPYVGSRVIDLSAAAARTIGVIRTGTAPVKVDVLGR